MNWLKYRRYMAVAKSAMGIAKRLTEVWHFTRKQQVFTLDLYDRVVALAKKRNIEVPEPKVKMYAE